MKLKFKEDVKSWNAKYLLKRVGWRLLQELAVARGLPNVVALELTTECTRRCWYCPVTTTPREPNRMSTVTITHVCEVLKKHKYTGHIQLLGYGEALIAPRLILHALEELRGLNPFCKRILATNGDLMTEEWIKMLAQYGLNELLITNHDAPANGVLDVSQEHGMQVIRQNGVPYVSNRIGLVEGASKNKPTRHCKRPQSVFITWDGRIALCCSDYDARKGCGGMTVIGDFIEKWKSPVMKRRRDAIMYGEGSPLCAECGEGGLQ